MTVDALGAGAARLVVMVRTNCIHRIAMC
jgi:hypothetical protein